MHIDYVDVPWWLGYSTLLIKDTPRLPTNDEIADFIDWAKKQESIYLPAPFEQLTEIHPWRHYPHDRWDLCFNSLGWPNGLLNRSFVDIGGNTGYYSFMAKAVGADRSVLVDHSQSAIEFANRLDSMYQIGIETFCQNMEDRNWEHFDVGFCFSALPYVGQKDFSVMQRLLVSLSKHIDVLFLETGDGGSYLEQLDKIEDQQNLFEGTGWKATYLDLVYASHTNTYRPLWKLEADRLTGLIYPFIPMDNSTQSRCYRDNKGRVLKDLSGGDKAFVRKEFDIQQRAFDVLPFRVPQPLECGDDYILMSDIGETEPITDMVRALESAEQIVDKLNEVGIEHGDLDPPNVIIKNNIVHIIDFGWSKLNRDVSSNSKLLESVRIMGS